MIYTKPSHGDLEKAVRKAAGESWIEQSSQVRMTPKRLPFVARSRVSCIGGLAWIFHCT
jgi:hypothetical protein